VAEGLVNADQRRHTGSGSALEACSRRCAIKIHIDFTLPAFLILLFFLMKEVMAGNVTCTGEEAVKPAISLIISHTSATF